MQELRLVAVSEDGTYLVLATAGRGTRFTLPVDDRLRAAVRGHFSRLGQFEIEVESPLRPKEIQARIRSGETAEEIAESAGIPVERVRWFEGPVLQEREYMAQQAQRVSVRRPGESTPGPPLGETVEERLGRGGVDLEESEWDSWKCEDNTWRVRLSFFEGGRPHAAEWTFDPRRRHVSPLDEIAARLTSVEWDDDALSDTVTPLVPRRPAMKVVGSDREQPSPLRATDPREYIIERGRMVDPRETTPLHEATTSDLRTTPPETTRSEPGMAARRSRPRDEYGETVRSASNQGETAQASGTTGLRDEHERSEPARPYERELDNRRAQTEPSADQRGTSPASSATRPHDARGEAQERMRNGPTTAGARDDHGPRETTQSASTTSEPRDEHESTHSVGELREPPQAPGTTRLRDDENTQDEPTTATRRRAPRDEYEDDEDRVSTSSTDELRDEHESAPSTGELREAAQAPGTTRLRVNENAQDEPTTADRRGRARAAGTRPRDEYEHGEAREITQSASTTSEPRDEHENTRSVGELREAAQAASGARLRDDESAQGEPTTADRRRAPRDEREHGETRVSTSGTDELRDEHESARSVGELREAAQAARGTRLRDDENAQGEPTTTDRRGRARAAGTRPRDEYEHGEAREITQSASTTSEPRDEHESAPSTGELREAGQAAGGVRLRDDESAPGESAAAERRGEAPDERERGESRVSASGAGELRDEHEDAQDEGEVDAGLREAARSRDAGPEDGQESGEARESARDERAAAGDEGGERAAKKPPAPRQPARAPAKKKPATRPTMPAAQDKPATGSPAAANGEGGAQRPARRRKAKGKRASVPSWDEIMFGARRPE